MSKIKFLGAIEAEKLQYEKGQEFCGTPCIYIIQYNVYPGAPGSSLCAGKLNGNRTYMVEITKPMGSYHIIDGEKVSVKYRDQDFFIQEIY